MGKRLVAMWDSRPRQRRNEREAWFWRGALRGDSPRTREGRRPERSKAGREGRREGKTRGVEGAGNDVGFLGTLSMLAGCLPLC